MVWQVVPVFNCGGKKLSIYDVVLIFGIVNCDSPYGDGIDEMVDNRV
jgi:hypothetical protein